MPKALIVFSAHKFEQFTSFFVEEQRTNERWRRIPDNPGPFNSSKKAEKVARDYSIDHHVRTRVVGEQ